MNQKQEIQYKARWEEFRKLKSENKQHFGRNSDGEMIFEKCILPIIDSTKEEYKKELVELIKNTPIEFAHTYASENAEIYRAYDNGQEYYKNKIINLINKKDE